jgi:hypothetical protein
MLLTGAGCSGDSRHTKTEQPANGKERAVITKPPSHFSDTVTINVAAAVFYNPDSLQLDKIKSITDPAIVESIVHDCFYQQRNARMVLKQQYPAISIIDVTNARYLLFEKQEGETICIDLNTENDQCGLFIFDGAKSPRLTDMTNIDTELGYYFRHS